LQEDTYGGDIHDPFSLNLYTYCHNNPLVYYDPSGHSLKSIWEKISGFFKKDKEKKEPITLGVLGGYQVIQERERVKLAEEKKNTVPEETGKTSTLLVNGNVTNNGINETLYQNSKLYKHEADLIAQINSVDSKKFSWDIKNFKNIYEKNKSIYEEISTKNGIPSELIAALHYRESGCNFNTYLHNGDPLGKPTMHVPAEIYFDNFTDAAVDALSKKKSLRDKYSLSSDSNDMAAMMAFAESYNGLGYYKKEKISPYVFSGTNVYEKGKYIADGQYDPNAIDAQPGVYLLINALKK
jgi:lysozyme family protein